MTRVALAVIGILAIPVVCPAQSATPDTTSVLYREIAALNRAMEASVRGVDARGAGAFYADNAVVRTPRQVVARGRAAVDQYFASIKNAVSWKLDVIEVGGDPDAPYQVGRSTLIYGARPDTSIVQFVVYWRRQSDGKLKIELDYYQ